MRGPYLSQFLRNRIQAFIFRLGVGKDIPQLFQFCLQLHDFFHVVLFLRGGFLNQGLFPALPICRNFLVVGMSLPKSLPKSKKADF